MRRTTCFRQLVAAPEILVMPCCHDGLSARVLEQAGFEAIAAAELLQLGGAVVAHPCGSVFTAVRALQDWAAHLRQHGSAAGFRDRMVDFAGYQAVVGLDPIRRRQAQLELPLTPPGGEA
jgi:2-methylisocitrate lyase-like PEP mutase family enzyme